MWTITHWEGYYHINDIVLVDKDTVEKVRNIKLAGNSMNDFVTDGQLFKINSITQGATPEDPPTYGLSLAGWESLLLGDTPVIYVTENHLVKKVELDTKS